MIYFEYMVEITLPDGQKHQSVTLRPSEVAAVVADFMGRAMVDRVTVYEVDTGEVIFDEPSYAVAIREHPTWSWSNGLHEVQARERAMVSEVLTRRRGRSYP